MSIRLKSCLFLLLLLISLDGSAAQISASVSRNPVALNESFQLTYRATEQPDGTPDWSPVQQQFDIANTGQNQSFQIINGQQSREFSWTLTLLPRAVGDFTIPPVSFGQDRSDAVTVKVEAAPESSSGGAENGAQDVYLELDLEPREVRLQQQIFMSVRVYRAVNMSDASLTSPEHPDLVIKKLGDDQQFEKRINGRIYAVTERRYALFPQRSGEIELPPLRFEGEVLERGRGMGSFFAPFGNRGSGHILRLSTEAVKIQVDPIPDQLGGDPWLPASNLQLAEAWPGNDEPKFQVGEPITRTLMLLADGLTSAQLPALSPNMPQGFKQYPDQPAMEDRANPDGVTGIRRESIAIVPTRAGSFELPAIKLRWWNTRSKAFELAEVPARRVEVLPRAPGATTQIPPAQPLPPSAPPVLETDLPAPVAARLLGLDLREWAILSGLLAGLWLATLLLWWRWAVTRRGPAAGPQASPVAAGRPADEGAIQRACRANDAAQTAAALLKWASASWPDYPPHSIGALARRCDPPLTEALRELERQLYAPGGSDTWQGGPLWDAWQRHTPQVKAGKRTVEQLARLHPVT